MSFETEQSTSAAGNRRQRRQYKCWHCSKVFKRSEHCIRHERIHTQEKPFSCRYCHKSYSRKDLVTRHERTLHTGSQPEQNQPAVSAAEGDVSSGSGGSPDLGGNADVEGGLSAASLVPIPLTPSDRECQTQEQDSADRASLSSLIANDSTSDDARIRSPTHRPQGFKAAYLCSQLSEAAQGNELDHGNGHIPDPPPLTALDDSFPVLNDDMSFGMDYQPGDEAHDRALIPPGPFDLDPAQGLPPRFDMDHSLVTGPLEMTQEDVTASFLFSPFSDEQLSHINPPRSVLDPEQSELGNVPNPGLDLFWRMHQPGTDNNVILDGHGIFSTASKIPDKLAGVERKTIPFLIDEERRISNESFTLEESFHTSICEDLKRRLNGEDASREIPPIKACQVFLSSYVDCFQCHLPVIHIPTFCIKTTPSPLILAMCSIGALYRLDRRRARTLYNISRRAIQREQSFVLLYDVPKDLEAAPLWVVQTTLLLTFYAAMSDDRSLVSSAMKDSGYFTLTYRKAKDLLSEEYNHDSNTTWASWIRRETWKRTLGGIYIVTTLMMTIYDVNPIFNATSDLDLEAFRDDSIWNAKTLQEWQEARSARLKQQRRTIRNILLGVITEDRNENESRFYHISPFSALFVMHGVATHMWQRLQLLDAFELSPPGSDTSHDPQVHYLDSALSCLSKCQQIIKRSREEKSQDSEDLSESPVTYNCQAILRIAYMRLFNAAGSFNRLCLLSTDPGALEISTSVFATSHLKRSQQMTSIVRQSFSGLKVPVKMGHMLVRKTAAFRMGVEHAVAAWDAALFITKWVHSVETDELRGVRPNLEEKELLTHMKHLLEEADFDPSENKSFAAGMARFWALFLEDVWVWAVTPRMGAILERLAMAYERVNEENRRLFRASLI